MSIKIPIYQYKTYSSKYPVNLIICDPKSFPIVMNGGISDILMVTEKNLFI